MTRVGTSGSIDYIAQEVDPLGVLEKGPPR
jgi:hypothetical protein